VFKELLGPFETIGKILGAFVGLGLVGLFGHSVFIAVREARRQIKAQREAENKLENSLRAAGIDPRRKEIDRPVHHVTQAEMDSALARLDAEMRESIEAMWLRAGPLKGMPPGQTPQSQALALAKMLAVDPKYWGSVKKAVSPKRRKGKANANR